MSNTGTPTKDKKGKKGAAPASSSAQDGSGQQGGGQTVELSTRDAQLLGAVFMSMSEIPVPDYDKFMRLGGYKTRASAQSTWCRLKGRVLDHGKRLYPGEVPSLVDGNDTAGNTPTNDRAGTPDSNPVTDAVTPAATGTTIAATPEQTPTKKRRGRPDSSKKVIKSKAMISSDEDSDAFVPETPVKKIKTEAATPQMALFVPSEPSDDDHVTEAASDSDLTAGQTGSLQAGQTVAAISVAPAAGVSVQGMNANQLASILQAATATAKPAQGKDAARKMPGQKTSVTEVSSPWTLMKKSPAMKSVATQTPGGQGTRAASASEPEVKADFLDEEESTI